MERQQINGSFLFSTNNINGMRLNDLQENVKIDHTKWNTLKFPENCKIKKIVCGSEFIVICNELNEIYYFGSLYNSATHFWNKLNIERKDLKIKNIFANYLDLIIQLENDDLIIYRKNVTKPAVTKIFNSCGIKFIFCGPLSKHFYVVDNKNRVYEVTSKLKHKKIDTSEIDKNSIIKFIGCSNGANLLVTNDNKIYGYGSSSFGELGNLQSTLYKFQYMSTPFEKESEIIDLKGGKNHFVVLLKSGIVYAIGNNFLGAVNIYEPFDVEHFNKLTLPLMENEFINGIVCSSRGTVLITKSNYAYFIGEVVYELTGYDYNDDNRINSSDNSIEENIESYNVNGRTIQKVKLNDEYNDVLAGGWHYIIYNNPNLKKGKSLQYFEKKLLNLIKKQHYNDISIVTVC
ncbi:hypothetical protein ABK040_016671 [Willaertia magna]